MKLKQNTNRSIIYSYIIKTLCKAWNLSGFLLHVIVFLLLHGILLGVDVATTKLDKLICLEIKRS